MPVPDPSLDRFGFYLHSFHYITLARYRNSCFVVIQPLLYHTA